MDNLNLLAHAGHDHEEESSNIITLPNLDIMSEWYVSLTVFIIIAAVMASVSYLVFKKSIAAAVNTVLVVCLLAGMLLFQYAPVVSVVAIVSGFALAFFVVLAGLSTTD